MLDGAAPPSHSPDEEAECPFCNDKKHKGYNTKHGKLKDEDVLRKNLQSEDEITSDDKVGAVYPLPGRGDKTSHWEAKPRVFEEVATRIAAAPHHIIPGNAAMAKVPELEAWTTASLGGDIKEDIGYNIDGAQNGVFLPRYPDLFGTKTMEITDASGKAKQIPVREHYGRATWGKLHLDEKHAISFTIMLETGRQIHQTSHGGKYITDPETSYDDEAREACNALADHVIAKREACADQEDKPYDPPYGLVRLINAESRELESRMTGRPKWWSSWCTRLAEECTLALQSGSVAETTRFLIHRISG